MSARKESDTTKSPYNFEANKRLLQPIWDRFKADLAKYRIRPWDRFEEKDDHNDNRFSIGQAVWDLPDGKLATLDYVSRCGRPDEFVFWSDFDHIKGRYEPGPTERLTHHKAIEEIRQYFGWVKGCLMTDNFEENKKVLQPIWDQAKDKLAQAGIRPWDEFKEYPVESWDFFSIGEAYWNLPEHEGSKAWVQIVYRQEPKGPVFRCFTTMLANEKEKCRSYSLVDAEEDFGSVIEYLKRRKGTEEGEKTGEKRKSPSEENDEPIDLTKEERTGLLAGVHAVCAEKKLKAAKDKAEADQEVMKIGCRADTTVNFLKKYGVYNQVKVVAVGASDYPNYTRWIFTPAKNIRLWVSHAWIEKDEAAEVTISDTDRILLKGTIQECVRLVAALLKAPESQ